MVSLSLNQEEQAHFFNSGVFTDGQSIDLISELFLQIIKEKKINFANIFGPAYKGIPLATGLAQIMFKNNMGVVNYVFDRKDEKNMVRRRAYWNFFCQVTQ